MAHVHPFRGMHVAPEFMRRVPAPAVDSMSVAQRRAYLATHPDSYLLVTRSPGDGGPEDDAEPARLIELGAAMLEKLVSMGAFVEVDHEVFFLYRLVLGDHSQLGIVGLIDVDDYVGGTMKRHEQVNTERADHLARHFEVVGAQSSAIAVGYRSDPVIRSRLDDILERTEPVISFVSGDWVEQTVWIVDDTEDCAALSAALAAHEVYIMDGHHRAAAAAILMAARRTPETEKMLCVLFADDRINIAPFHRRVRIPAHLDPATVHQRLSEILDLRPDDSMASILPRRDGLVGVWSDGAWWSGTLPEPESTDPVSTIDPVRLQRSVIGPLFDIDPSRPEGMIDYFLDTADRISMAANSSDREVLFVLRPVTPEEVFAVADAGLDMPPKSTYVTPKARSGVFLRRL